MKMNATMNAGALSLIVAMSTTTMTALATAPSTAPAALYPHNRPPLQPRPFIALPLGSVKADGWLLAQLHAQRDGLTGNAETALAEIDATSAWRGGDKDNWEKSPYYLKGLVPLAYTLDDATLKARAQVWIDWILSSQRDDGFYGPAANDDWWPRMVSNYVLRDYHDATGDPRVPALLTKYYRHMLTALPGRPLKEWGKSRAADDMDTVMWLYNRTGDAFLLELVDLLRKQAYDWPTIMHENRFQSFGLDYQPRHNVNVPQASKFPAVAWQRTGDARDRAALDAGDVHLMRDHGTSMGLQSGTEFLSGSSSGAGIEFCSIVEQMLSDETTVRIFGDAKYADRLERLAYNALPAAWNRDLTALRYYTLPNHVIAVRGGHGFGQDYGNGVVFGPRSGFPCCCFNVHQGWPKFVQNSWAATPDGGLAVIAYAPSTVTAKVAGGATATIVQQTDYPFADTVRFRVTLDKPATFPLTLRTPAWCEGATLTVNGKPAEAAEPGAFANVTREWKSGDEVVLTLPMKVRVERGNNASASVHRGPLMYTLDIDADRKVVGQPARGFDEFEQTPEGPWNYALALDAADPAKGIELLVDDDAKATANPFAGGKSPVSLRVQARKLPDWGLAWNGVTALDPPRSPVQTAAPVERVTLVPFGTRDLRLTDFPVIGPRPAPADLAKPVTLDFADGQTSALLQLGGGWWAHDGVLRTVTNGGAPGFKALVQGRTYGDVTVAADVTPAPAGDAGVMARVTKASIGPDAFQGYYAGIVGDAGRVVLGKSDGKTWTELKRVDRPIPGDRPTKLRLSAAGDVISVYVDDEPEPVIRVTDAQWKSGQVGVRMYTTDNDRATAVFDNLTAKPAAK